MTASGKCILVVAAVPQELQDFRLAPLDVLRASSNGVDGRQQVSCLVTGMGQKAGEVVRRRLSLGDVGLVVSTGFAGGIRPGFEVGDLVMASEVIHASSGERFHPNPSFFGLKGLASVGPFVTVERPLSDPQAKSEAGIWFGAIAADLETAVVAQAATQTKVAWVALRAILDPMELPLQVSSPGQALRCLVSPGCWEEFSGFLKTIRTASKSLADGLHCLLEPAHG